MVSGKEVRVVKKDGVWQYTSYEKIKAIVLRVIRLELNT